MDKRTAESVLFAFKRMLTEWNYAKESVKIDTDTCCLKVGGKEILKTRVENFVLQVQWMDGEWEHREELQTNDAFKTLRDSAQQKLDRAKDAGSKGKAKGKSSE